MSQGADDGLPVTVGDDPLNHDATDDRILGTDLDDSLSGHDAGDDSFDGGSGRDTLVYEGHRSEYKLTRTADGFTIDDHVGTGGHDTIAHIKR
jgi:Ca2+-binding RTX toxin-like protein